MMENALMILQTELQLWRIQKNTTKIRDETSVQMFTWYLEVQDT